MGKSIKSRHYQKIIQKWSQMEGFWRAMYLQKWLWMEGLPRAMFLQKSCGWKGFQGQHIYRNGCGWKGFQGQHFYRKVTDGKASKGNIFTEMVVDGRASKHNIFTERGQGGIGCPLTGGVRDARWNRVSPDTCRLLPSPNLVARTALSIYQMLVQYYGICSFADCAELLNYQ